MKGDMDLDTFMREGIAGSDSEESLNGLQNVVNSNKVKQKLSNQKATKKTSKSKKNQNETGSVEGQKLPKSNKKLQSTKEPSKKKIKQDGVKQHKDVIGSLAANDPEFYKFLQEEDKNLLNFDDSSGDDEEEEEDEDGDVHKLPSKLVEQEETSTAKNKKHLFSSDEEDDSSEDSEDSDEEDNTSKKRSKAVAGGQQVHLTAQMIERWAVQLASGKPQISVAEKLVKAFQSCVMEASGESADVLTPYKVEGVTHFNAVVRACLRNFPIVFAKLLDYKQNDKTNPSMCKKWSMVKNVIRTYLTALSALLKTLAAADVLNAVLKHVSQLTSYITCFPKQTRVYMKTLIRIWSSGEETSRVLSFISIVRLIRLKQEDLLERTLKAMYMAYVRNCKFTSPVLLPLISFMQHSLVEIFSFNKLLGYQYTFVYVRQLAIHLRNAMVSKKKDCYQTVYNWQFIHSCMFFTRVICNNSSDENISQLLYPLVQVIIGCIKLIPTAKFYPLRFQCIRMLNLISKKTDVYVPTLAHLMEILEITDFQKKTTRVSLKPLDFSCVLKLSKSQTQERAFKDGVMDQLYELILDHLTCYSHTIGFPELVVPALHQMKQFVKTCKVANFTKSFKQLISKITETSQVIELRRRTATIDLSNPKNVKEWETRSKSEGTPMTVYYKQYRELRDREVQLELSGKERMESYDNTVIIPTGQRKASETERKEFATLFNDEEGDNSDDDSSDDDLRFSLDKKAKTNKRKHTDEDSDEDDAESLDSDELALLEQDAAEDQDSCSDDDVEVESEDEAEPDDKEAAQSETDSEVAGDNEDDIVEDLELSDIE